MSQTSEQDFLEAFHLAKNRVLTYGYYLTGESYLAEALTREAFVWVFLRRRRVMPHDVVNLAQRRLHAVYLKKLRDRGEDSAPPVPVVPLVAHQAPPDLLAALRHLTQEQRVATVMHVCADLTPTEVAWVMRCWPRQVREHLDAAKTTLTTLTLTDTARTLVPSSTLHDAFDRLVVPSGPPLHVSGDDVVALGQRQERTRRRAALTVGAVAVVVATLAFRAVGATSQPQKPTPTRQARGELAPEPCRTSTRLHADLGGALPALRGYQATLEHDGATPVRVTVQDPHRKAVAETAAGETGVPGVTALTFPGYTLVVGVAPAGMVKPLIVLTAGGEAARGTLNAPDLVASPSSCAVTVEVLRHATTNGVDLPVSWRVMDMAWFSAQGVLQKTANDDVPQPEYVVLPHIRLTVNTLRGVGMVVEQSALRGPNELRDLMASAAVRPLGMPSRVRPLALSAGLPQPPHPDVPWRSNGYGVYCVRVLSPVKKMMGRFGGGAWQPMTFAVLNGSVSLGCQEGPDNVIFTARWVESDGRTMQCQGATFLPATLTMQDNAVAEVRA